MRRAAERSEKQGSAAEKNNTIRDIGGAGIGPETELEWREAHRHDDGARDTEDR